MISANKPQISESEARLILDANKVTDKSAMIGIRGYYQNTYGRRGENDRNVYDDAIIVISERGFETFRANTDPSIYRAGVATMKTGVHRYYKGKHKNRYWALRLVGEQVAVTRDGETGEKIGIALNIHKGGCRSTGSLGCQTIQPADWDDFIEIVYDTMDFYRQKTIPYVLIDEQERRNGAFKMKHAPDLSDHEIDSLLIEFDKFEPAEQVGKTQKPATNPATNPPSSASDGQPQTTDASAISPVQNSLPSLDGYIGKAQDALQTIDQLKIIKDALGNRSDGKKSLWSTVGQAIYQMAWAMIAFVIGLPIEVWLVVALIVAVVGVMYLYRQNSLGKIRETARLKLLDFADYLK